MQGFKRMSQLVKDVDLYVATPEVKEYTGAYSKPSDLPTSKQVHIIITHIIAMTDF